MVGPKFVLPVVLLVLASACNGGSGGGSISSVGGPLAPYLPSSSPTPSPDLPPTNPGSNIPTGAYPTTSTGGYYSITQMRTLAIQSNETPMGFAVSGTNTFMFEEVNLTGGIVRWRILSTVSEPGTGVASWTIVCDLLGDGSSRVGFAADSTYFYLPGGIPTDPGHEQYLRRFSQSNCSEASPLDTGQNLASQSWIASLYSISSNVFYFGNTNPSPFTLFAWNMANAGASNTPMTGKLAGVSLPYVYSVYVTPQATWALTFSSVWKINPAGTPIAWGELPENTSYALTGAQAVIALDSNTLVVITTSGTEVNRTFLDVSEF